MSSKTAIEVYNHNIFYPNEIPTLEKFTKNNYKSKYKLKGGDLFQDSEHLYIVKDNIIYEDEFIHNFDDSDIKTKLNLNSIAGIIVNNNGKRIIISTADDNIHRNKELNSEFSTSLVCLARFFGKEEISPQIINKIKFVAVTKDEWKESSIKKPPEYGFTLRSGQWHRPGFILFSVVGKKNRRIILGQDENTFFGCELKSNAKTIADALLDLAPPEVRNLKTTCKRQGEWFFLKVDDVAKLPKKDDKIGSFYELPKETKDSNIHTVHSEDIRVDKKGNVFAFDPILRHDQHEGVDEDGWVKFVKNTAIRSFSQEGVD